METVFDVIQALQLNFSQTLVVGVLIFIFGYIVGTIRIRKLNREKDRLEKEVMELNEELLYSTFAPDSSTKNVAPVIGLKTNSYKTPQIAK